MPSMGNNFGAEDGCVTERLVAYYNERAKGGPGLIITEMVSIDSPLGRRGSNQLRIDDDRILMGSAALPTIHNSSCKLRFNFVTQSVCSIEICSGSTRCAVTD